MRKILAILASITFLSTKAQTHLPIGQFGNGLYGQPFFFPDRHISIDGNSSDQKWHLTHYAAFSAGTVFGAGSISFLSVPVGLQLTRTLNKNLYAFAGVSAAPVYFSFNRLFTQPPINSSYPGNPFPSGNGLGLNSRVEAGLMYVNDAKTFSISGSVGVERTSYPLAPQNRPATTTKKQ